MSEYTLIVKIPNAGNKEISYSVNLTGSYEAYPKDYFAIENNKFQLRETIQTKTARQVNDAQLKRIIDEWIRDIHQNLRRTTITVDLPTEIFAPPPISTPPLTSVTPPNPSVLTPIQENTSLSPTPTSVSPPKPLMRRPDPKPTPAQKPDPEPSTEKRRTDNKFDFDD